MTYQPRPRPQTQYIGEPHPTGGQPPSRQNREHRPVRRRRRRRRVPVLLILLLVVGAMLAYAAVQYHRDTEAIRAATEPTEERTGPGIGETLTIAAGGDVIISTELLDRTLQDDGSYDFSPVLMGIAPLLADADLTVVNVEANFCSVNPTGNNFVAPPSLLTALKKAGVDLVQTANTASIYNGVDSLAETSQAVRQSGLLPVGTFPTAEEYRQSGGFTLVESKGFRVAFVAFTKGMGNLRLPEGSEHMVNVLYTDYNTTYQKVNTEGIQAVLEQIQRAKPDITVALVHWGSEYETQISDSQKRIEGILLEGGVDAILGSHSHIVGEVSMDQKNNTLTAYSLGNLISTEERASARQSLVLRMEFTRTERGVELTSWKYDPIYLANTQEAGAPRALHADVTANLFESQYYNKGTRELYDALLLAKERVASRVLPQEEDP